MYLEGIQVSVDTKKLKEMIGTTVTYLLNKDIDKTGRGYFFPRRRRKITAIHRRCIEFDNSQDYIPFSEFREIVLWVE